MVLAGAERVRKLARNKSTACDVVSSIALSSSLCQITRKTAHRKELAHMQTNGLSLALLRKGIRDVNRLWCPISVVIWHVGHFRQEAKPTQYNAPTMQQAGNSRKRLCFLDQGPCVTPTRHLLRG